MIAAASVCGRIGKGFKGGPEDRRFLERMRAETDASLIGAGSLRDGQVQMLGPGGRQLEGRLRAVITASGRIPVKDRLLFTEGAEAVIFTSKGAAEDLRQELGQRAHVFELDEIAPGSLDLGQCVSILEDMGAKSLLVEGGPGLNYQALKQGIVDEILLTICPKIIGDASIESLAEGPGPLGGPSLELRLLDARVHTESSELFLRYQVLKNERTKQEKR